MVLVSVIGTLLFDVTLVKSTVLLRIGSSQEKKLLPKNGEKKVKIWAKL